MSMSGSGFPMVVQRATTTAAMLRVAAADALQRWHTAAYGALARSPLYRLTLPRRGPAAPLAEGLPARPGSVARGRRWLQGADPLAEPAARADGTPGGQDFAWMDDLATLDDPAAGERARVLALGWVVQFGQRCGPGWQAGEIAPRILRLLAHWRLLTRRGQDGAPPAAATLAPLLDSLIAQTRHLARIAGREPPGAGRMAAVAAAVAGTALLEGEGPRLRRLTARLGALTDQMILPDGGHASRAPGALLSAFRDLVEARSALAAIRAEIPRALLSGLDRAAPMLRFLRHGDGGLAVFHGGGEGNPGIMQMLLELAGADGAAPETAPHSRFQRATAGRALLIVDSGPPPPPPWDARAHAAPLAFELSVGRDRIIVNCGAFDTDRPEWQVAQRATAAHSTLTIGDTNAVLVRAKGGLGLDGARVEADHQVGDGAVWLDLAHDGYQARYGVIHRRRLYLAADGRDLRGEDSLSGAVAAPVTLRFHLHPRVTASLIQNGRAVLLRLGDGSGWRFLADGGSLSLQESVYLAGAEGRRATEQIVVTADPARDGPPALRWSLKAI